MFARALTLATIAFSPVVLAEGGFLGGLQGVLTANGLTRLVNITSTLNSSAPGQEVISELSTGSKTLFAPTDAALEAVNPIFLSNSTILADLFAYHIVSGDFINLTGTFPNATVGRTLLNDSTLVSLEGNKDQVLTWAKSENGSLFVQNQGGNVSVVNQTRFENTNILIIDDVLIPPPNATIIFANSSYDITSAATILQSTSLASGQTFFSALITAHGFTAFVPNNEALASAQGQLSGLSSGALHNVLENHLINATTLYSSSFFPRSTFVSAAGQVYTFVNNATGLFVSVGGSNQVEIVQRNVLTSNGVIHILNGVMIDTNANLAAASSAFVSATSVAAQRTTETGPVGVTATTTVTASPTATTTHAGAIQNLADLKLGGLAGLALFLGQIL